MKPLNLLFLSLITLLVLSCTKEGVIPSEESILEFASLEVGNYWVYKILRNKTDGSTIELDNRDTVRITGDTLISNTKYLIKSGTRFGIKRTELLFDSANSIFIYPTREMLFTLDEKVEVIKEFGDPSNPIAFGTYSLNSLPSIINVPAGEFECLNFQGKIKSSDPDYEYGVRLFNSNYSKNVGLVSLQNPYYNTSQSIELKLVDYGKN